MRDTRSPSSEGRIQSNLFYVMTGEKFITLAIHSKERADALRSILESHGIEVRYESIMAAGDGMVVGIRVKIKENDLPLALKVAESSQCYVTETELLKINGTAGNILIPVDFSPNSLLACRVGFDVANRLKLHPVILHAFTSPYLFPSVGEVDDFDGDMAPGAQPSIAEMAMNVDMKKESERQMRSFRRKIEELQDCGSIPSIKFSSIVTDGIPEDVIKDYCVGNPPAVVVMATRGKDRRDEELVGSVTAEVLDSCRVPVFVVPENCRMKSVKDVRRLIYFCNLDRQDILSVDSLMRMFDYPEAQVTLIPVSDKNGGDVKKRVEMLKEYFSNAYPASTFSTEVFPVKTFRDNLEDYISRAGVEMMIVPNRKRNVFQRLFNPGIAHKLLFERDMPMLALPV